MPIFNMAVKWLILDAMGVVYRVGDDVADLLVPYIRERNQHISSKLIEEAYFDASLGSITSAQFWDRVELGSYYPAVEIEYLHRQLELMDGFESTAEGLGKRYRLAMLSNDVGEWSRRLRAKWELDKYFDEYVISGDCGIRKPDAGIYQVLLSRIRAAPSDCVFVDDRPKNLAPARQLGFNTCLFSSDASMDCDSWSPTISGFAELPAILTELEA